jgi:hypothetical protein
MTELTEQEYQMARRETRAQLLKQEECIICLEPLGNHQIATFMRTPCSHKFHKRCLVEWIDQKY